MNRVSSIPRGRGSRMLQFGRLAGGIAAGMAAEGVRRLASGNLPTAGELLLTPQNAARLADRLSELRGAAMKVGQLLSMEAGDLLPVELANTLSRLREDAHQMPLGQVGDILQREWGSDWSTHFKRFDFKPLAAASIGQVHAAIAKDGRHLAVKIQYPGVRESINSDVDNVAKLISMFNLLPDSTDIAPLLAEAKRQLHEEADYLKEAANLEAYSGFLGDHDRFVLPQLVHEWTTPEVLTMTFVTGDSLETLEQEPQDTRDLMAAEMMRLAMRELFEWGLVQTDPNFANYRFDRDSGRIALLDFGAARHYSPPRVLALRRLLSAGMEHDKAAMAAAAIEAGYMQPEDPEIYREAVTDLLLDATSPLRKAAAYNFAESDLANRMSEKVMTMRVRDRCWRLPATDLLFLHRKIGGLYMLFSRLRANVPVGRLSEPYLLSSVVAGPTFKTVA